MTYITTKAKQAKHKKSDRDIYFDNLEEAYGNLPVPSDDWADIGTMLGDEFDKDELERAILTIQHHYDALAKVLGKQQKYG